MTEKQITAIALALNIVIVILEIIGFALAVPSLKLNTLIFYTEDSNFLALISSVLFSYYIISGKDMPDWLSILKYISTLSVTVTFFVVVFVLSWMTPDGLVNLLISESMLYHHTLCPILAIITFVFFEKYWFGKKDIIKALYFTFIYAVIMIGLNILKIVDGPYPFLRVSFQPVWSSVMWIIIIIGFAYVLAAILKGLNEKFSLKKEN